MAEIASSQDDRVKVEPAVVCGRGGGRRELRCTVNALYAPTLLTLQAGAGLERPSLFERGNSELGPSGYVAAERRTAADILLNSPIQFAHEFHRLGKFPNLARVQARPAHQRALERGGSQRLGDLRRRT